MEEVIKIVTDYDPSFSIFTTPFEKLGDYKSVVSEDQFSLLKANIEDRDILVEGKALLIESAENHTSQNFDKHFGSLLYKHYQNLRDHKRTSTPKIERMMNAALSAGALGGKINGSGGGGCMFAYAPTHAEEVAEAIEREGGKSYIITVDEGTRIEG